MKNSGPIIEHVGYQFLQITLTNNFHLSAHITFSMLIFASSTYLCEHSKHTRVDIPVCTSILIPV